MKRITLLVLVLLTFAYGASAGDVLFLTGTGGGSGSGTEVNNLETVTQSILDDEVPVGKTAGGAVEYKALTGCSGAGEALQYDDATNSWGCLSGLGAGGTVDDVTGDTGTTTGANVSVLGGTDGIDTAVVGDTLTITFDGTELPADDIPTAAVANLSGTNTGDEPAADLTTSGIVELATGAETNTGTDATRAVTPDGLDDWTGSAQVTTLGTVGTGVWQGTEIADAYVSNTLTCSALTGDLDPDQLTGDTVNDNLVDAAIIPDAGLTAQGVVELATGVETNTGTDATRAVTPDGLDDWTGSAQVTTLGTIGTGVWQGTEIADAYIPNDITITETNDLESVATNIADNEIPMGTAPNTVVYKTMPATGTNGCAGAGEALQYNTTTDAWTCLTGLGAGGTVDDVAGDTGTTTGANVSVLGGTDGIDTAVVGDTLTITFDGSELPADDIPTAAVANLSGTNTGDEPAADLTTPGIVELATGAETNTGTDATRAVTPDGLDDWTGSAQVTTIGTVGTGVWQGTEIADAYVSNTLTASSLTGDLDPDQLSGDTVDDNLVDAAIIPDASLTAQGVVELATGAETNTGTDATRAVTPDGLDDWTGSAQVTTLGTIGTGTWQGTAVADTYIPDNITIDPEGANNEVVYESSGDIETNAGFTFNSGTQTLSVGTAGTPGKVTTLCSPLTQTCLNTADDEATSPVDPVTTDKVSWGFVNGEFEYFQDGDVLQRGVSVNTVAGTVNQHGIADNQTLVGTGAGAGAYKTMPATGTNGCAGAGEALQYNTTTDAWACLTGLGAGGTVDDISGDTGTTTGANVTVAGGTDGIDTAVVGDILTITFDGTELPADDIPTAAVANLSGTNTGDEPAADLTTPGIVELATGAETNTGTDATRAVTPDGLDDWTGSAQLTTVAANAVEVGELAQVATDTLLGRTAAGTGDVSALTVAEVQVMLGVQQYDIVVDTSGSGDCAATRAALEPINDNTLTEASVLISGAKFEADDHADTGHLYKACFIIGPSNAVDGSDFPAISVPGSNVISQDDSFFITTSPGMHLEINHTGISDDAVWMQLGDDYRRGRNPGDSGTTGGWGSITNGLQVDLPALRVTHINRPVEDWTEGVPFGLPFGPAETCTDTNDDASTPGDESLPQTTGSADGLCDDNWTVKVTDASPDDQYWLLFMTGVSHANMFSRGGHYMDCDGDNAIGGILVNRSWGNAWHRSKTFTCGIGARMYGRQSGSEWYSPDFTNGAVGMLLQGDQDLGPITPYSSACAIASGTNQCKLDSEESTIGTSIIGGVIEGNTYYQVATFGGDSVHLKGTHIENAAGNWRDAVGIGIGTDSSSGKICTVDADDVGNCEPQDVSSPVTLSATHSVNMDIHPMLVSVRADPTNNDASSAIGFGPGATRFYDTDTTQTGTIKLGGLFQASDPDDDDGADTYFRYHTDLLTDTNGAFLDVRNVELIDPFAKTSLPDYPYVIGRSGTPGVFHSRDWGADVTGDDTDAVATLNRVILNNAIQAACNWGGGTVHLDAGDYRLGQVTSTEQSYGMQVDCDGITIEGEGDATVLLPHNPYDGSSMICVTPGAITDQTTCGDPAAGAEIDGFVATNFRIYDDDLDNHSGSGGDPGTGESSGFILKGVKNFEISKIRNLTGDEFINVMQNSHHGVIRGNNVLVGPLIPERGYGSGSGITLMSGHNILVTDNILRGGALDDNASQGSQTILAKVEKYLAGETGDAYGYQFVNNQMIEDSGYVCWGGDSTNEPTCVGGSNPGTACDSDNDLVTCLGGGVCTPVSCTGDDDTTTCGGVGEDCSDRLMVRHLFQIGDNLAGDVYDIQVHDNVMDHGGAETAAIQTSEPSDGTSAYPSKISISDNLIKGKVDLRGTDIRLSGGIIDGSSIDSLAQITGLYIYGGNITVDGIELLDWGGPAIEIDDELTGPVKILNSNLEAMANFNDSALCIDLDVPHDCCTGAGTGTCSGSSSREDGICLVGCTGALTALMEIDIVNTTLTNLGGMFDGISLGTVGRTRVINSRINNVLNYSLNHVKEATGNVIVPSDGNTTNGVVHINRSNAVMDNNRIINIPASACLAVSDPIIGCTGSGTKDGDHNVTKGFGNRSTGNHFTNNTCEGVATTCIDQLTGAGGALILGNRAFAYGGGSPGSNIECGASGTIGGREGCTDAGVGTDHVAGMNIDIP